MKAPLVDPTSVEITIAKSIQLSCATLFFYCCGLHFHEEVQFIWAKRWSSGKVFYFLSRYSGAAFLLYANITTSYLRWFDSGVSSLAQRQDLDGIDWDVWNKICILGHLYTGPGLLVISLAEVVLMLRVYALYEKSKKVLITLLLLFTMSMTYNLYQTFGGPKSQNKFPCFGSCENPDSSLGCTLDSNPVSYIGWLFLSLVEMTLFVMVISKYRQSKRQGPAFDAWRDGPVRRRDITSIMAHDSTRYFALIFTICLLGCILAMISELPNIPTPATTALQYQLNTYQTIVIAIMSFLAPQLLINVRKEYYYTLPTSERDLTWELEEVSTWTTTRERPTELNNRIAPVPPAININLSL